MRSLILAAAFACSVSAFPSRLETRGSCLSNNDAYQVAHAFQDLINKPFNATLARAALVPGYTDYSDSVAELINKGCNTRPATLTAPTFSYRSAFIQGQSGQKPIPFEILNLWNNCEEVTIRWRSSAPGTVQPEQPVTGIIAMEVVPGPSGAEFPFQIKTVFSEFNSGAWLYDLVCPFPMPSHHELNH